MGDFLRTTASLLLTGSIMLPEASLARRPQDPPGSPRATSQVPAAGTQATTPKALQDAAPVTSVTACGFCLEDGTKVPLTLVRELSSGKNQQETAWTSKCLKTLGSMTSL